jgi:hypothetical protein
MIGQVGTEGNGATNILRSLVTRPVVDNVTRKDITIEVVAKGRDRRDTIIKVMVVGMVVGMVVMVGGMVGMVAGVVGGGAGRVEVGA